MGISLESILGILSLIFGFLIYAGFMGGKKKKTTPTTNVIILILSYVISFDFFYGTLGAVHYVVYQEIPSWAPMMVTMFSFIGSIAIIAFTYLGIKNLLEKD